MARRFSYLFLSCPGPIKAKRKNTQNNPLPCSVGIAVGYANTGLVDAVHAQGCHRTQMARLLIYLTTVGGSFVAHIVRPIKMISVFALHIRSSEFLACFRSPIIYLTG